MRRLNSLTNCTKASADLRYWEACRYYDADSETAWIQAFDSAQHRGIDISLMLEHWSDDLIH